MAKSNKVNKSQLVREILKNSPHIPVADVVKAMADQGHKVTPNLVYFLRGKAAAKKSRKKRIVRAARAAAAPTSNGKADAITLIREVRALAEKAGGYENLKELVEALAE